MNEERRRTGEHGIHRAQPLASSYFLSPSILLFAFLWRQPTGAPSVCRNRKTAIGLRSSLRRPLCGPARSISVCLCKMPPRGSRRQECRHRSRCRGRWHVRGRLLSPATTQAATNKLYYAATFDLPEPGWYSVEVSIIGALGETHVRFDVEAAEPLPPGLTMLPWVGWPLLVISLFVVHQFLVNAGKVPPGSGLKAMEKQGAERQCL